MPYRAITILVLLGYLAGQMAAMPHAHATAHADHPWQPHVHLSVDDAAHVHHSHDGRHHHDDGRHDDDIDPPNANGALVAAEDHDADAVYVSAVVQATSRSGVDSGIHAKCLSPQATPADVCIAALEWVSKALALSDCASGIIEPHCALYLSLRTLRI
jgi:hypothetical protein